MARKRFAYLAVLVGLSVGATLASAMEGISSEAPAEVSFAYSGASAIQGRFIGSCLASGVEFTPGQPHTVQLDAAGGVLYVVRTRVNVTVIAPDTVHSAADRQWVESSEVAPGPVGLDWTGEGLGVALVHGYGMGYERVPVEPFPVALDVSRVVALAASNAHETPAGYYWAPGIEDAVVFGREPALASAGYPGWNRVVEWMGRAEGSGNMTMYLRQAHIQDAESERTLDPFIFLEANVSTPFVSRYTILYTDAFLDLRDSHWEVPADANLVCRDLEGRIQGSFVAEQATGIGRVGSENVSFQGRALTLEGDFQLAETPRGDASLPDENARVEAQAKGDIRGLGIDFVPVAGGSGIPTAVGVSLVALLLAAILLAIKFAGSLAGFLYSRFGRDHVLDNPNRDAVYQAVRQNPGADLSSLQRVTSYHLSTVAYHVQVLERVGLVGSVREGKRVRVLPKELHHRDALAQVAAADDERVRFLVDRARGGPLTVSGAVDALRERFGLLQRSAYRAVERALRSGSLVKRGTGRGAILECAV